MAKRCNFFPGQRVVCVDDDLFDLMQWGGITCPVLGQVYTIRDVGPIPPRQIQGAPAFCQRHDDIGVRLVEIVREPVVNGAPEPMWGWTRFRPVTDIRTLEALLHTTPTPVKENA